MGENLFFSVYNSKIIDMILIEEDCKLIKKSIIKKTYSDFGTSCTYMQGYRRSGASVLIEKRSSLDSWSILFLLYVHHFPMRFASEPIPLTFRTDNHRYFKDFYRLRI